MPVKSSLFRKTYHFFPIRLIVDQVKHNIALIGLWLFLWAIILGGVGKVYGIHYLFLDPEYQQEVGFFSFWWVGLALGNFIMAFHITSYILIGHRYPFIAILERPFSKFAINNLTFPVLTLLLFTVKVIWFQWGNETISKWEILWYLTGFYSGLTMMVFFILTYLKWTNTDIFKYLVGSVDKRLRKNSLSRERMLQRYKESRAKEFNVQRYLDHKLRVRDSSLLHGFPDRISILKVFDQNHLNGVLFEIVIILFLLMLGLLVEKQWAQIPAASSVLLVFSMISMIIGAVSYWFRGWGVPILILLFISFNLISRSGWFSGNHAAVGLDYNTVPASYSITSLHELVDTKSFMADSLALIQSLDHWRVNSTDSIPPKLVLLCVSGGGQRAALWTVASLQSIDQLSDRPFFEDVFSITGASGGMIGAAYYRELYLKKQVLGLPIESDSQALINMGKDNLNALVFSLISNDIFIDIKKKDHGEMKYVADRGILFEYNLNRNLEGAFTRKLTDYKNWEESSQIPRLILSPVISNDGRRLYLSASTVGFMTRAQSTLHQNLRGVDFNRLFKKQHSDSLTMLSALRMSASFPYITPTISLPSDPGIEVMDAGIADNFGVSDAIHLTYIAREWINANTSGVILLSIRDTRKISPIEPKANPSLIHRFTYPIASVYNNLSSIQDVRNEQMITYANSWLQVPVQSLSMEYDSYKFATLQEKQLMQQNELTNKEVARASLSWHLTSQEKRNIIEYVKAPHNQRTLKQLHSLLY